MSNPTFPVLTGLMAFAPDSSTFEVTPEDPAIKAEMEGGYMISRKRHTRTPRLTFSFGYRSINEADKNAVQNFWNQMGGGSLVFDWTDPQTGFVRAVRFKDAPTFKYKGRGFISQWDVDLHVEEV